MPISGQTRLSIAMAVGLGVGVVTAGGFAYWYLKWYRKNFMPPKKWRLVGEVGELLFYPIKSCGPIRVKSADCKKLGLQNGYLKDRNFMVIQSKNGEFISARQYPKMVTIRPKVDGNVMRLSVSGMMDVEFDLEQLANLAPIKCWVWNQLVEAIDCGEEAAKWLSRVILDEDTGLRLVYYPRELSMRNVRQNNQKYECMLKEDTGAFHDASSYMALNFTSLCELNARLQFPVTILHFRPNIVLKGARSYEEDHWKWIKIGKTVIFKCVKPCTRCILTNINPETGVRNPEGNPLNTLKSYRYFPHIDINPIMGTHLGVRVTGKISIGDPVYVEAE